MNYTKITPSTKAWQNIITEDLNTDSKTAFYKIGRFSIYRLKILRHNCTDRQLISFMITGDEQKGERSLLFLEMHHGLVIKYVFQTGKSFDSELTKYLGFALMVSLRKKGIYIFSSGLAPFKKLR